MVSYTRDVAGVQQEWGKAVQLTSSLGGIAASALNAFSVDMAVRANNIANVNTPEFHARNVTLTSGYQNQGVTVASITEDTTPGPILPDFAAANHGGTAVHTRGYLDGSNTDLAREFTGMIATQHAYTANAITIRTVNDMTGTLLDMKI